MAHTLQHAPLIPCTLTLADARMTNPACGYFRLPPKPPKPMSASASGSSSTSSSASRPPFCEAPRVRTLTHHLMHHAAFTRGHAPRRQADFHVTRKAVLLTQRPPRLARSRACRLALAKQWGARRSLDEPGRKATHPALALALAPLFPMPLLLLLPLQHAPVEACARSSKGVSATAAHACYLHVHKQPSERSLPLKLPPALIGVCATAQLPSMLHSRAPSAPPQKANERHALHHIGWQGEWQGPARPQARTGSRPCRDPHAPATALYARQYRGITRACYAATRVGTGGCCMCSKVGQAGP